MQAHSSMLLEHKSFLIYQVEKPTLLHQLKSQTFQVNKDKYHQTQVITLALLKNINFSQPKRAELVIDSKHLNNYLFVSTKKSQLHTRHYC